jgi:AcrR family transcriptional regulator
MSLQEKNVRLRRTQKLLREVLVELIDERGFDAITIGELTTRAMVSRAAFYRNYQDKYDLVEQIFEEAMSALLAAVGDLGRDHPAEIWVRFFEHETTQDNRRETYPQRPSSHRRHTGANWPTTGGAVMTARAEDQRIQRTRALL